MIVSSLEMQLLKVARYQKWEVVKQKMNYKIQINRNLKIERWILMQLYWYRKQTSPNVEQMQTLHWLF